MTSLFKHSQDNKYLFSFGIQVDKTGKMTLDEEKLKQHLKKILNLQNNFSLDSMV